MTVTNGFILLVLFTLLYYMNFRLFIKRDALSLISAAMQVFSFVLALLCFVDNIRSLELIQAAYILLGIIFPLVLLICDYRKMMLKVKESGIKVSLIVNDKEIERENTSEE